MKLENMLSSVLHDHGRLSNFRTIYCKLRNLSRDLQILLLVYIRKNKMKKTHNLMFGAQLTLSLKQVTGDY